MPSILGSDVAQRLLELVNAENGPMPVRLAMQGRYGNIAWSARHASRHHYNSIGKTVLTGGLTLVVTIRNQVYGPGFRTYTQRLSPRWGVKFFTNMIQRMTDWALIEHSRAEKSLELMQLVENASLMKNTDFIAAVEAKEKELGRDSCYDTMSVEDVDLWKKWVKEWMETNTGS